MEIHLLSRTVRETIRIYDGGLTCNTRLSKTLETPIRYGRPDLDFKRTGIYATLVALILDASGIR